MLGTNSLQNCGILARRLLQEASVSAAAAPLSSKSTPPGYGNSTGQSQYASEGSSDGSINHFTPSIAIITVVLLCAFFFIGFVSLYVRRCADHQSSDAQASLRRAAEAYLQRSEQGVDPDIIQSFPLVAYSSTKKKGNTVECVVCLTDFEENEPLRQLPSCKHVFHQDCIEMWLFSHSTCPLCRRGIARGPSSFRWGSGSFRQLPFLSRSGGSTASQQLHANEEAGTLSLMPEGSRTDSVISIRRAPSTEAAGSSVRYPVGEGMNGGNPITDTAARAASNTEWARIANAFARAPHYSTGTPRRRQMLRLTRANSTGHSLQLGQVTNDVNADQVALAAGMSSAAGLCRSTSELPQEYEGDLMV